MGSIWIGRKGKCRVVHTGYSVLNHSTEMRMWKICLEKQETELTGIGGWEYKIRKGKWSQAVIAKLIKSSISLSQIKISWKLFHDLVCVLENSRFVLCSVELSFLPLLNGVSNLSLISSLRFAPSHG